MRFMVFLDSILIPLLQPLLDKSPFLVILIVTFIISLITTLAYKFFTNQEQMKQLREEQKEFQNRMKELRSNPEESMKVQKEAMKKNMEYMKHSIKPMIITFLPIILIFGWMNAHLMYEPIFPGEKYSLTASFKDGLAGEAELIVDSGTEIDGDAKQQIVDGKATWSLESSEGRHQLTVKTNNEQQVKKVLITTELKYEEAVSTYTHSDITQIVINYNELKPLGPKISIFGWYPGWIGLYFILSVVFSIGMRKILKIY